MSGPTLHIVCGYVVPVVVVLLASITARVGSAAGVVALIVLVAINQALLLRARLRADRRAWLDSLTGLPGRAALLEELKRASHVGLVFVDLDRFKDVNDRYGHIAGDNVLVEVAERIRQAAGESATVARYGGDEFAVLVPANETAAVALAIERALRRPIGQAPRMRLSASVGAAVSADGGADLVAEADAAMYHAKRAGMWTDVPDGETRTVSA